MVETILSEAESKMDRAIEALQRELAGIRTGHATPAMVDSIKVDYHGAPIPLRQIATISVPEAGLIIIQPWDRNTLAGIEKAILKSELGINPSNDGNVIRLAIPPMTEERRREMAKALRKRVEEGRIEIRNLRRDAMGQLRAAEKEKEISQDECRRALEQLQKLTEAFIVRADHVGQEKEKEILEV
jgi:ribosome recycling factor